VYQRGWVLGGKAASTRGTHGRIEEHGLHVWLGYYDNAFRLIRDVYDELDRRHTDTQCPIRTWRDAFSPVDRVGLEDDFDGTWSHWIATFSKHPSGPGDRSRPGGPLAAADLVMRGLNLMLDFVATLPATEPAPTIVLSSSPWHPRSRADRYEGVGLRELYVSAILDIADVVRTMSEVSPSGLSVRQLSERLAQLSDQLVAQTGSGARARRTLDFARLVTTCVLGTIRDGLLVDPAGFAAIDHLDFRAWLRSHGASAQTCDSPLVRGMYDLAFAYEEGDPERPAMSAGLGLFLAGKLFFDYTGSILWRMEAGMGETVIAPIYQALAARDVKFRFFHRVKELRLNPARDGIATIRVASPERLAAGVAEYQPLIRMHGLPCFPEQPLRDQLATPVATDGATTPGVVAEEEVELRAGSDFDVIVLAIPPAMIRSVADELVRHSPRWHDLVTRVASVPTQSLQVWLRESMSTLGWDESRAVVTGYMRPFESYAPMSHLIPFEDWPAGNPVRAIGYFCSVLPASAASDPDAAREAVRANAAEFLARHVSHFWPRATTEDGSFRWDVLWSADGEEGPARLASQYWRANVDPSDQYVQALPGTSVYRMQVDESGYSNLFLAGDWVNSGLNAGCIEAAVMSGVQTANAVLGRPLMEDVLGDWYGVTY
jgi:uncharacterized protein with NAD-binding domain and iron-sulfur cluster